MVDKERVVHTGEYIHYMMDEERAVHAVSRAAEHNVLEPNNPLFDQMVTLVCLTSTLIY